MDSYLKDDFTAFIQELSAEIDEVFIAMPSVDWNGAYDYDELAFASDGLFIMAYGYHSQGGSPGPISPLHGGGIWSDYAIDWSVDDYLTWGAPADSIIVGLPLYGRDWPTTNTNIPGTRTGDGAAVVYTSALSKGQQYGRNWDSPTSTAYTFPDDHSQLWYDDQQSLHDKIQWAADQGIQGVGFWALTYEDGDAALWEDIGQLTRFEDDPGPAVDTDLPGDTDTGTDLSGDTEIPDPPAEDDDTVNGSDEDAGGCGCATSAPTTGWALFALPLASLVRRRERRLGA